MKKLAVSIDNKHLPGNQSIRVAMVLREHERAIDELDSDVKAAKEKTYGLIEETGRAFLDRHSELESRIAAIENTRYRRFGRWVKRIFRISPKKDQANDSKG